MSVPLNARHFVPLFLLALSCLTTLRAQPPEGQSLPEGQTAVEPTAPSKPGSGKVLLQFRNQEWLPALQWLAKELEVNLDWQQLPEDQLSLFSTEPIALEEAEDMFNMQLLARGFVLVKRAGVLRLLTLKDLDVTLVPRVEPQELDSLPKHSVVRVSFPLEWMIAEDAAKELQPLLSPYGKLSPMASSNRLEAVDAVVNLREFHRLLNKTEKDDARRERVAEFKLVHRKAEEVAPKVRQLLGLPAEGSSTASGQTQLDIEQARFRAEAVKQMGRDAQALITEKRPSVFLVVNDKENSLLINAPPNKIEIVRQAVEAMDKPAEDRDSAWETISRVKVYEVNGFDPDAVSKMILALQERGSLDRDVRVQVETAYNRLIAFASAADQVTIAQIIESFRAEKRSAVVLPLSSLDPAYAAKAIQVVLKTADRPSTSPGVPSDGKFQVEPDPEHHRLLLWATPAELAEVREFLARLGENFSEQRLDSRMHIIETHGQDVAPIVEKLKRVWGDLSESPVVYESEPVSMETPPTSSESTSNESSDRGKASNRSDASSPPIQAKTVAGPTILASTKSADAAAKAFEENLSGDRDIADENRVSREAPPVRLMHGPNGDLIVLSRDPVAAESAKRLIQQMLKAPTQLTVIQLKHTQAYVVKRQLDTIVMQGASLVTSKLTSAPVLTIDVDQRTNRLLIQNANDRQLALIDESVRILDQPNPDDEKLSREQLTIRLKNRRANVIAEAIRSVYQDLLIMNERTLNSTTTRTSTFNRNIAATTNNPEYQGLLSIGVDAEANILIISAPKYLVEEIRELAESMDTPTDSNSIAVVPFEARQMAGDKSDSKLQENIRKILSAGKR